MRYKATGEVHKDFHGLTCATLHYLVDNYGEQALAAVLTNTAQQVFKSIREALAAGDCRELAEYWDWYLSREGGDFEVQMLTDGVRLVVRNCPALRHLVKLEQKPDAILCEATRLFNAALSADTPYWTTLDKTGTYSCVQTFAKGAAK